MMNIYAEEGHKVIVTEKSARNGLSCDRDFVERYLEIGKVYTVHNTVVGGWHTSIYLEEVPRVAFNSVNFEDYTEEVEIEDFRVDVARECLFWCLNTVGVKYFDLYQDVNYEISYWDKGSCKRRYYDTKLSKREVDFLQEVLGKLGYEVE